MGCSLHYESHSDLQTINKSESCWRVGYSLGLEVRGVTGCWVRVMFGGCQSLIMFESLWCSCSTRRVSGLSLVSVLSDLRCFPCQVIIQSVVVCWRLAVWLDAFIMCIIKISLCVIIYYQSGVGFSDSRANTSHTCGWGCCVQLVMFDLSV